MFRTKNNLLKALCALVFACALTACDKDDTPDPGKDRFNGSGYAVSVNGESVKAYTCRVSAVPFNQVWDGYQRPVDQTEIAFMALWDQPESGPAEVEVTVRQPITSVRINPSWAGVEPRVEGQKVSFSLTGTEPRNLTLEVNGPHNALHLFACAPEVDVPAEGSVTYYYGPGIHRPGRIKLQSGARVYLAPDAVVFGSFYAVNASDIRIWGRGTIDGSQLKRGSGSGLGFSNCSNVKIEGVVLRDSPMWCCALFGCTDVEIDNVKIVGLWRYNADGIDVVNSSRVRVKDCFVRSFDDALVVKGLTQNSGEPETVFIGDRPVEDVTFERCVVWCDWGRGMCIGAETFAPSISNVVFRDIDVIRTTDVFMDILHGNKAAVSDITFENIRAGIDDHTPEPVFQTEKGQVYADPNRGYVPRLMSISIAPNGWLPDGTLGTVDRVTYKNVTVYGGKRPASDFTGNSAVHRIDGVEIDNLVIGGAKATDAASAGLEVGEYVQNVQFR